MSYRHLQRMRNRGTALVEMALVGMLLITLTFGMIEYSWMFYRTQELTNACRQAARVGATADGTTTLLTNTLETTLTQYGLEKSKSNYTLTVTPAEVGTATKGQLLTVTISIPYTNVSIMHMAQTIFPTPSTIHASMSMEKEGE